MDHTRNGTLVLCLDGDTVTIVSHGDDGILQIGAICAGQHGIQLRMDLLAGLDHGAADAFQLRACVVRDFLFGQDTAIDFIGNLGQRSQLSEQFTQRIVRCVVVVFFSVCFDAGYIIQNGRYLH